MNVEPEPIRVHLVVNGVVTNTILAKSLEEIQATYADSLCIDASAGGVIGDYFDGQVFTKPPPPPQPVPTVITMRQARLALLHAGLLNHVNTSIANLPGVQGDASRIEWEFSSTVERHKLLIVALTPVLGMTDAQIDSLFIDAASL
ncbi:hypothetical protein [Undibacterium sp. Ji50W]|uniref:hypothetical protein n=1 Tax=Undibacterium sp. Ji50W TaxID=3413041 RepID=UPI003BF4D920